MVLLHIPANETCSAVGGEELYERLLKKLSYKKDENQDEKTKEQLNHYRKPLHAFVNQLKQFQKEGTNKTDRLTSVLEDFDTKYDGLVKGVDEDFMLFVVGMGNYGKSTLINALLETEAADVGVLPKTWKIDIFCKDIPEGQVIVKYRNNSEIVVDRNRAKEIVVEEESKRSESDKKVSLKLKEAKNSLTSYKAFKELKLKLEREEIYNSDIVEMHWGMARTPILNKFRVVDTPGLTQVVMGEIRTNVQDYYHKADGVLWMLDATAISAAKAKDIIEDLEKSLENIGRQQQNIIGVLNRIDQIYISQGEEGVRSVIEIAETIYKGYFRRIIPFSALQGFDGSKNNDQELIEKSGLNQLHREINYAFYKNAKRVQYNKKLQSASAYNHEIARQVKQFKDSLDRDWLKLKNGLYEITENMDRDQEKMKADVKAKITTYRSRVEDNIRYQLDSFLNIKDSASQTSFINDQIFEIKWITSMLKGVQSEQVLAINNMVNHYNKKLFFTEYPNLIEQNSLEIKRDIHFSVQVARDGTSEDLLTYGSGIGAGLVASMFLGPFGLLVGGLVSWFAKNSIKEDVRSNLEHELTKIIMEMTHKIEDNLKSYMDEAREHINKNANSSFAMVYSFGEDEDQDWDKFEDEVNNIIRESENVIELFLSPDPNAFSVKKLILQA